MARRSGRLRWEHKQLFTTGEAAEICGLSQQTIIRRFDSGRLEGFKVPGSRFRRIPRDALLRFMRANGISTEVLEGSVSLRLLVIDDDPSTFERIEAALRDEPGVQIDLASTGYDAGVLTERLHPHLMLLRHGMADLDALTVCRRVKMTPLLQGTAVLILARDLPQRDRLALEEAGADQLLAVPLDPAALRQRVHTLREKGM